MILKFIWKHKRHRKAQRIISNRNTARGISFPEFWLYYKTIAIQIAYFLHKNGDINQLSSTEDPNVSPFPKNTLRKRQHFQQMVLDKADSCMQKNEAGPSSLTLHKTANGSGTSAKDLLSWFPLNHFSRVNLPAFTFWQEMSKDQVVPSTPCLGASWADHTGPGAHFLLARHESCEVSSIAQGCPFLQLLTASSSF